MVDKISIVVYHNGVDNNDTSRSDKYVLWIC